MRAKIECDFLFGLSKLIEVITQISKPILVVIAGGSCSGKSYLAVKLKTELEQAGILVSIILLDKYFRDIDDSDFPRNENGRRLFDVPDSYYQDEFIEHASMLLSGKDIRMPDYDVSTNKRLSSQGEFVKANPVIIAEGLFAIRMLNNAYPNLIKVYVEANEEVRLRRRINRDTLRYNVSSEKVEETFRIKVLPCHYRFIEPQKQFTDFIVRGGE